jgi:protein-tyrosine-phosphatase
MAAAMAKKYGSDVLEVSSAGLSPAGAPHPLTSSVLAEKNIELGTHTPVPLKEFQLDDFDLLINISGFAVPPGITVPVETWDVEDPVRGNEVDFRRTREELEMLVMRLILRARAGKIQRRIDAKASSLSQ